MAKAVKDLYFVELHDIFDFVEGFVNENNIPIF